MAADERRQQLDALAARVQSSYARNHMLTINLVASELDSNVQDVAEVLDSYQVESDGRVTHVGPGQGNGWIPEEVRATLVSGYQEPEHIGYRWPDGSIHEEQYEE